MSAMLFDTVRKSANISPDGLYRYSLHRDWRADDERPYWVTFIMLNPSTADADLDDPTIRRCIGFAKRMGGTGLAVVNLYAYRATKPADMLAATDPVGPKNDWALAMFLSMALDHGFPVIAAWGANARADRVAEVRAMHGAQRLQCLGITKDGAPRHPLYLRADAELMPLSEPGRLVSAPTPQPKDTPR